MEIVPYLTFDGKAAEAMKWYAEVLGARMEALIAYGDMPGMAEHCPADQKDLVAHARLNAGGFRLMASDAPGERYAKPQGTEVCLQVPDPAEAERLYKALSAGGEVVMELQETVWAQRFAMFRDRYGTPWMINCEKPMDAKA